MRENTQSILQGLKSEEKEKEKQHEGFQNNGSVRHALFKYKPFNTEEQPLLDIIVLTLD